VMRTFRHCLLMLAVGAVLAFSPALALAASAASDKDASVSPVEKLRKDLDKPITLKIAKQSLTTAVEMLRKQTKINFVLDGPMIQQLGFTPDQPPSPVDVDLKDVTVRTALRSILSPYNLSFAPIGDTVVITTDDMAMFRQMRQRVSVDLEKTPFADALKQISRQTGANLILDARVEKDAAAKVSLQMEDVPLETAVRLLAEMAGLKPVRVGNVLFVTGKANANEMRNDPDIAQPNQNLINQQQQLLQLQLNGNGIPFGGAGIGAAPPGVAPAVPPGVIQDPGEKDDKAPKDESAKEDKSPTK
jgi:hypothetical protein